MHWPVRYSQPSAMRKVARFFSSPIWPTRPIGMPSRDVSLSVDWPGESRAQAPSVGKGPGAMALRRMPYGPHSAASDFVMMLTPAFDMADGTVKGPPFHTHVVRMEMTLPGTLSRIQRVPIEWVT